MKSIFYKDIVFYPTMLCGVAYGLYCYFFSKPTGGFYHNWGSLAIAGFFLVCGIGALIEGASKKSKPPKGESNA